MCDRDLFGAGSVKFGDLSYCGFLKCSEKFLVSGQADEQAIKRAGQEAGCPVVTIYASRDGW